MEDQDATVLIHRQALPLDEFDFHIFQIRVIELEMPLEGAIGQASPALEHGYRLVQDLLKGHRATLPMPMRRAEDGVGIGKAVRVYVDRTWSTKESKYWERVMQR